MRPKYSDTCECDGDISRMDWIRVELHNGDTAQVPGCEDCRKPLP